MQVKTFTLLDGLVLGSPKRRPFQRQRAASETTDHTDSSPMRDEVIDSITHTPTQAGGLQALSAESLSHRCVPSHDAAHFSQKTQVTG